MTRRPLFLRPLTALTEEEEAAEVAEIVRLVEAAFDAADAERDEVRPRNDGGHAQNIPMISPKENRTKPATSHRPST